MKITIYPDADGYIAEVVGQPNMFAFGMTQEEARMELRLVLDGMMEFYLLPMEWEPAEYMERWKNDKYPPVRYIDHIGLLIF